MRRAKILGSGFIAFMLGMAIGEILPDPTDVIHFAYILPWLEAEALTAPRWMVVLVSVFDWYLLTFLWFFALALIAMFYGETVREKILVVGSLLGAGAVIGLVARFLFTGVWL